MNLRPFPKPTKTLWQLLGPSIIFVALALNGGEMLLWPNLAANYGLSILWPIPIILCLQYIVNIEIERYTLVTGESVEGKLVSGSKGLSVIFAFTVLIALVWPAWMTTAGNLIAVMIGYTGAAVTDMGRVVSICLLVLSVVVFYSKNTYHILERITRYGLSAALLIILLTVIIRFDMPLFIEGLRGLFSWGFVPADMPRFDFVAALAYGGVAGVLNLVQSEWIMAKGYGVASLPSHEKHRVDFLSDTSKKHFTKWFSLISKEHFLLFVLANVCSIFLLAYLGRLIIPIGEVQGFAVLVYEINALNAVLPYMGTLFGLSGVLLFVMANITILDAIGRLIHRIIEPLATRKKRSRLSAENISIASIGLGILILLVAVFVTSFKQPFFLLVTSASLSAFTMWLYPPLLLKLNLSLPRIARPSLVRIVGMWLATAFYGFVTLWALLPYVGMIPVMLLAVIVGAYQLHVFFQK